MVWPQNVESFGLRWWKLAWSANSRIPLCARLRNNNNLRWMVILWIAKITLVYRKRVEKNIEISSRKGQLQLYMVDEWMMQVGSCALFKLHRLNFCRAKMSILTTERLNIILTTKQLQLTTDLRFRFNLQLKTGEVSCQEIAPRHRNSFSSHPISSHLTHISLQFNFD